MFGQGAIGQSAFGDLSASTGTISLNELSDSGNAIAQLLLQGSLLQTESADIIASQANLFLQGSLSGTEFSDTLTTQGLLAIQGNLSVSENNDVLNTIARLLIQGSTVYTEVPDSDSATGEIPIGLVDYTEAFDSLTTITYKRTIPPAKYYKLDGLLQTETKHFAGIMNTNTTMVSFYTRNKSSIL